MQDQQGPFNADDGSIAASNPDTICLLLPLLSKAAGGR